MKFSRENSIYENMYTSTYVKSKNIFRYVFLITDASIDDTWN